MAIGLVKMPDRCRIEGVVEPREYAVIHMKTTGLCSPDPRFRRPAPVPDGPSLIAASSPELEAKRDQLLAEIAGSSSVGSLPRPKDAAAAQIMDEKIAALEEQITRTRRNLETWR
jgi:hypothetical protein